MRRSAESVMADGQPTSLANGPGLAVVARLSLSANVRRRRRRTAVSAAMVRPGGAGDGISNWPSTPSDNVNRDGALGSSMRALPSGTVTFLFTDVEGSTRLLERHPEAFRGAVAQHHAILCAAVEQSRGAVFETVG